MPLIPYVIEQDKRGGERAYDIYSRLLQDRIVILNGVVEEQVAGSIIAQLLLLDSQSAEKEINFYINSPGGVIYDGLAIYDTMQFIKAPVRTICIGKAMSMGAYLLAAGAKGKRMALPNATIMIHQPSGGFQGTAADIEIGATEILRLRKRLNDLLADHTGKPLSQIEQDVNRDHFLTADAAKAYGIIDEVITKGNK